MSQEKYFDKFPKITYSNNLVVDITSRVTMLNSVYNDPFTFYPYDLSEFERPDQLSNRYYNDPYKSWILYLSNKIIDPYYEWYLQDNEFNEFIISKYGSLELAISKIKHYTNNWVNKENISTQNYSVLPNNLQEYWEPVYGYNNIISSYTRIKKDWIVSTNHIVSYNVSNTNFIKDEMVNIVFDNDNVGKGQILSNTNPISIQHTSGTTLSSNTVLITSNSYIYGTESFTNSVFTSSTLMSSSLNENEEIYWKPVTYYEYETQKNEYNKNIRILDKKYSGTISNNLKTLLSSN